MSRIQTAKNTDRKKPTRKTAETQESRVQTATQAPQGSWQHSNNRMAEKNQGAQTSDLTPTEMLCWDLKRAAAKLNKLNPDCKKFLHSDVRETSHRKLSL